jgi:deoxyribodipyrimidine photolyase
VSGTAGRATGCVLLEVIDSNGLLPLRATTQVFQRASDFRRFLQKELPKHLGAWAQEMLKKHAMDKREVIYDLDEFQAAKTHDALWNAAQTQLVGEGNKTRAGCGQCLAPFAI